MNFIALLCLLPVVSAYNNPPCGLSYEEAEAYKGYADRVKNGLIASCNLFKEAENAIDGFEPDLENGIKYWVTTSMPYEVSSNVMTLLKEAMQKMPTNLDYRVKTYGCAFSLKYNTGDDKIDVGCLFS
ncbi:unnamed protein product [Nippostrongylus brasiliensis]|uniref:SCP domain-containing protein n=1 Tax=Nippostrongylus brasiliensis TaxID=27835 RepID=A0A0N4YMM1_NIPBR|nr:unnamed protein product [Nippostrongylus brasiliensis]